MKLAHFFPEGRQELQGLCTFVSTFIRTRSRKKQNGMPLFTPYFRFK